MIVEIQMMDIVFDPGGFFPFQSVPGQGNTEFVKRNKKGKTSNEELDKRQSEILLFWEQFNQAVAVFTIQTITSASNPDA